MSDKTLQQLTASALRRMAERVEGGGYGKDDDVDLAAIEDDVQEEIDRLCIEADGRMQSADCRMQNEE